MMIKSTEVYKRVSYNSLGSKAIYAPTTGEALDCQVIALEFSLAGSAIEAPETIKITVEYEHY